MTILSVPFSSGQWLLLNPKMIGSKSMKILSVPFSSGQWLLLNYIPDQLIMELNFQSPFRRGNGCYYGVSLSEIYIRRLSVPFSSGQWLLLVTNQSVKVRVLFLSVPFSSGQWLLQCELEHLPIREMYLSVPFSSGQWLLPKTRSLPISKYRIFQSPFRRGNGCYRPRDQ